MQETFIKLWEDRYNLDETKSIKAYIFIIANNLSLNYIRHKKIVLHFKNNYAPEIYADENPQKKLEYEEFNADKNLQIFWIEGKLYFDKTPLSAVFNELERFYNIIINYSAEENVTFSGMFQNDKIELVLQTICSTAKLNYLKNSVYLFEVY